MILIASQKCIHHLTTVIFRYCIKGFEYSKKTARERGPALVGIELKQQSDFQPLIERMNQNNIQFEYINDKPEIFEFLI